MLEHPSFWLSPPTATSPPGLSPTGRRFRRILAAESREPLGHVAVTPGRWLPWPAGPRLAVYEEPDASLLFTAKRVRRMWPVTAVAEADGIVVALVYGRSVASSTNQFLAQRRTDQDGRIGSFVNEAGLELSRWRPDLDGVAMTFTAEAISQPFLMMGLLAAVLIAA